MILAATQSETVTWTICDAVSRKLTTSAMLSSDF